MKIDTTQAGQLSQFLGRAERIMLDIEAVLSDPSTHYEMRRSLEGGVSQTIGVSITQDDMVALYRRKMESLSNEMAIAGFAEIDVSLVIRPIVITTEVAPLADAEEAA